MTTILVVDDEPQVTDLMRDWLTLHRYDVVTTSTGHEAIRIARTRRPDLMLLDVLMPDLDGVEVCKRLRADSVTANIPIILVSGQEPTTGRVEGLMAGASDYITKPVNLESLAGRMRSLLGKQHDSYSQSERLLQETLQAILAILPCNLAWLLTLNEAGDQLVSRAVAASGGEQATTRFLRTVDNGTEAFTVPVPIIGAALDATNAIREAGMLVRPLVDGTGEFNLPLSELRAGGEDLVFRACEFLNLYFATIVPLQMGSNRLGILFLGSFEPRDVESTRGQQILAASINQAAMAVDNARLMHQLVEREAESQRERMFRQAVLDTMGDGLLLYDDRRQVCFANRRLAMMTGYTVEALNGVPVEELVHPADRERVHAILFDSQPPKTSSFEFNLLSADDKALPVLAVQASGLITRLDGVQERIIVISDLSEHNAREQVLIKQSYRLAALNRAAQAINSTLTLDEAIFIILNEATTALNAQIASVLLRPPDGDELFFHSAVGPFADKLRGHRIPIVRSLAGYVASEGLPVLVPDAYGDSRFYPEVDRITGLRTRSMAAVPLLVQEEVVGVVQVISEQVDCFDLDDLETLQGLARSAAVAIENASLFGETQRQVRELTLLLRASEAASSTLAIETVLETVARQLIDALSVTWCVISSWARDEDCLIKLAEVAEVTWPPERGRTVPLGDYPLTRAALESGEPFTTSIDARDVEPARREILLDASFWSVLSLPVEALGQVIGVIELYHSSSQLIFSEADVDRCQTILLRWQKSLSRDNSWGSAQGLRQVCQQLLTASGTSWCTVLAYVPGSRDLKVVFEAGQAVWPMGHGESHPLDDSSLRRVALMERTAVATRLDEGRLSPADRAALPRVDSGSILLAPLMAHGEAIGLVQLIDIEPHRLFSDTELSLAQAIANVVGNALENGRLYSALARRAAQLEAAYNDLRDADRTTDEMIQNISHELRTPLAPIIGYTDMLLDEDLGELSDGQRRVLETVSTQGRLLTRMVKDILTVQNVVEDPLNRGEVALGDLANAAVESTALEAQKHSVELKTDIPEHLPVIYGDEERLLQVFENLLSNAIKFSPQGGQVRVAIRDIGHSLQVEVSDQGIGIAPEEFGKIWRRFYQIDGSTTRAYNGLGLGLTIVKQVVEKHEGHVSVASEPGKGSVFVFTLPKP